MRYGMVFAFVALFASCSSALTTIARADSPATKLTSAGEEPREVLRYSVEAGQEQVLFLSIDKAVEDSVDNRPTSFTEPPTTILSIRSVVKRVGDDGAFEYDFTIQDADLEKEPTADRNMQQIARQAMNALVGVSGSAAVSANGVVEHLSFNLGARADTATQRLLQQLRQVLNQVHRVLPDEPIGTGAKWNVTQELRESGKTVKQTSEFTLVSRNADTVQVSVRLQVRAESQPVQWAKLGDGTRIQLLTYEGTGRGESQIDLKQVYPMNAEVNLQSLEKTRIKTESMELNTRTNVSMKVRMQTTDLKPSTNDDPEQDQSSE